MPGNRCRKVCSINSKPSSVSLFEAIISVPNTLSRAKAIASLPIPVEFNSLLLWRITTSTGFNVCFVGETGGLEKICWLDPVAEKASSLLDGTAWEVNSSSDVLAGEVNCLLEAEG